MKKRGRKPYSKQLAKDVRWYYKHTSCSITRIAAHFNISFTTVNNMISKTGAYKESPKDDKIVRANPTLKINLKPKFSWIIFDGRAWDDDTDNASVYCAYDSTDSKLTEVYKDRAEFWEDGVIFEYDQVKIFNGKVKIEKGKVVTYIVNQRLLG